MLRRTVVVVGATIPGFDFGRPTYQGYLLLGDPALALPGAPAATARPSRHGGAQMAAAAPVADPADLSLASPFPNPASTNARMDFVVPPSAEGARFEVAVLDVMGRRVRALERGAARPGPASVTWDLRDDAGARVREGLYFMRVALGSRVRVTRVAVVR